MSINLSKSKYCLALQCPKMLWLKTNKQSELSEFIEEQAIFETGNEVGDVAMRIFGEYKEVQFGDLKTMIEQTGKLISSGELIIAEGSFSYDGLFCSVDILKNLGDNNIEIYEVKSSTNVKEQHIDDVAYQNYVLKKLGYNVKRGSIVYINNQYMRKGELDINQLFHIKDVTETSYEKLNEVKENIEKISLFMQQSSEPKDDIGTHCFSPYGCDLFEYCTKHLPKPNVFDLAGARTSTKLKYYNQGIISFKDLAISKGLSATQYMQIEHELQDCGDFIKKDIIKDFLGKLSYPLFFLDFESFQTAVPLYDNTYPYEQIVFQYSLHYIEHEGGELKHTEFLGYPNEDPRRALAEKLCEDIPFDVCTTSYNMSFEKTIIKKLADLFPDLASHLMNVHDNIYDLMMPFQKKYYYTKAMKGSYSIKYVLPALFPNDLELNYQNLEGVKNGVEASATFKRMISVADEEELKKHRTQLLKYCSLDTFAMVKVWEKLNEVVKC